MSSPGAKTTVTVLTAARMLAIEAASVVSGAVNASYHLILTKHDGSTIDAGNVRGPAGPTGPQGDGVIPGEIKAYGGSTTPTGYLLCNGQAISRTTYATLFGIIGTTYGAGDGTTTFNVPNIANKFLRGNTTSTGGGADSHTHTSSPHSHNLSDLGQAQIIANASGGFVEERIVPTTPNWSATRKVTGTSGATENVSGQANGAALQGATDPATAPDTGSSSNVPAYVGVRYIIKT